MEQYILASTAPGADCMGANMDAPLRKLQRLLQENSESSHSPDLVDRNSPLYIAVANHLLVHDLGSLRHVAVLNSAWAAARLLLEHGYDRNPRTFDKGVTQLQ